MLKMLLKKEILCGLIVTKSGYDQSANYHKRFGYKK